MTRLFLPRHLTEDMARKRQAIAFSQAALKDRLESNAEYQKLKATSKDQKFIDAIERLVNSRKQFNDFKAGHDTTLEQARQEMLPIIQKYARDQGIE
jgi:aminoglycoside N3'-acetyltransferase